MKSFVKYIDVKENYTLKNKCIISFSKLKYRKFKKIVNETYLLGFIYYLFKDFNIKDINANY